MSETDSVFGEEEEGDDEEEDVSVLSSLETYQLCLKYQQVLHQQVNTQHAESALVISTHDSLKVCSKTKSQFYFPFLTALIASVEITKQNDSSSPQQREGRLHSWD